MFKILDVGCGARPKGDVNIDLYLGETHHRTPPLLQMQPKKIPNFMLADALYLPFRSNCFDIVYSHHVIEHVSDSIQFMKEAIRVSNNIVKIICPHRYARGKFFRRQLESHQGYFSIKWFHHVLKNFTHEAKINYKPFPLPLIPLINWVHEIEVTIYT